MSMRVGQSTNVNTTKPLTFTPQNDGNFVVNFKGEKLTLSPKDVERYTETFAKMTAVPRRIQEIEMQLNDKNIDADKKVKLEAELVELKELKAKQDAAGKFEISPDGKNVTFKVKSAINVEQFKELYNIQDGAFRGSLKQEALEDGVGVEDKWSGFPAENKFLGYDDALYTRTSDAVIYPYREDNVLFFSNGVKLIIDDTGHYGPDYTEAHLSEGEEYTISSGYVQEKKEGLFGWGFFGL